MNKLFLLNGVSTAQLKIISIDDAGISCRNTPPIRRFMSISQSIQKCQYVIYSEKMHFNASTF